MRNNLCKVISILHVCKISSIFYIPFRHSQAIARAPSWYRVTPPTDNSSVVSINRRRISTCRSCLDRRLCSKACPSSSSSELRRDVRITGLTNDDHGLKLGSQDSTSETAEPPERSPFLGRIGGAGNPLRIPVLSSSASVPLSLVVCEDLE